MPIRLPVLSLFLLATSWAQPVAAARLWITGTPGAELRVDGESLGSLPLGGPLELEEGAHAIELRRAGYRTHRATLRFDEDEERRAEVELMPLSPRTAAAGSMALAGLGQFYSGRPKMGWTFLGLQVAAATAAVLFETEYKSRREDYEIAQLEYDEAVSPADIAAQRVLLDERWERMKDVEPLRDTFLYSIFGIAALSALDAWWHFPDLELSATPSADGVRIGLGRSF